FVYSYLFFFQAEDGIRDFHVTGVQTCALPIWTVAVHETLDLADGGRLVPYAADNNLIATGCVLLPSGVGTVTTQAELIGRIQARSEERRVGKKCRSRGAADE